VDGAKYRRNLVHIQPFGNGNQRETTTDSLNKPNQESTHSTNPSSNSTKDIAVDNICTQTQEERNKIKETNSIKEPQSKERIHQRKEHSLSDHENNSIKEDVKESQILTRPKRSRKMPKNLDDYVLDK